MSRGKSHIETDYPADVIEQFVTWLTEHGYNYQEVFASSLKTQNYYMQRFIKESGTDLTQLKLPL